MAMYYRDNTDAVSFIMKKKSSEDADTRQSARSDAIARYENITRRPAMKLPRRGSRTSGNAEKVVSRRHVKARQAEV